MQKYQTINKFSEYNTSYNQDNAPETVLTTGSKNCLIDGRNGKVMSRSGYTRLGASNTAVTPTRNSFDWNTSTGQKRPLRFYNDQWETWLETIDGTVINAWTKISGGMSTTAIPRFVSWYDSGEAIDLALGVQNDANMYEWNGAVAVISALTTGQAIGLTGNSASLTAFGALTGTAGVTDDYNGLVGSALRDVLKLTSNPTDGQTLILNINSTPITITFVAVIGAVAGNVLIGGTLAQTVTNLLGLLNSPGSTTANQVALSGGNQTLVGYITYAATTTVTKAGTTTFGQNRFYSTRNEVVVCVRTGTAYTYSGGVYSQTLTGISDITGLQAGDILIQQLVTTSNVVSTTRNNSTIFCFQNQIMLGSDSDQNVYISKNTDYDDFGYSSPRVPGEGALLTLNDPVKGFGALGGNAVVFCGLSFAFKVIYTQQVIQVDTTTPGFVTEAVTALPLKIGVNQGLYNQETLVPLGNSILYLSNEPAIQELKTIALADQPQLQPLSNPIKPDFDAEDFTNACAIWYKNAYFLSAPANSHVYILGYIQTADGKLSRYWQPPQVLPVRSFSIIDSWIHGHSNSVPETYKLFYGRADTASDNSKLPIDMAMYFAYRTFGDRANLKSLDEFYLEGEITNNTVDAVLNLNYDFGGNTQVTQRVIDGSDEGILEQAIGFNSLAQESLGADSLGSLLNPPTDARKFRVVFELAKEDFHEIQAVITCNEIDRYIAILSMGPNAIISTKRDTGIRR